MTLDERVERVTLKELRGVVRGTAPLLSQLAVVQRLLRCVEENARGDTLVTDWLSSALYHLAQASEAAEGRE